LIDDRGSLCHQSTANSVQRLTGLWGAQDWRDGWNDGRRRMRSRLESLGPILQVKAITSCHDTCRVTTANGGTGRLF
jgi:hypothetical protein